MNEGIIEVFWSDEDKSWVAVHSDFPSLSYLDDESHEAAVVGLAKMLDGI